MIEITPEYLAAQGLNETFLERYWAKVNKCGPIPKHVPHLGRCWMWTASTTFGDYGSIGSGPNIFKAHRCSWILHYGPIPKGMCVLHKCDVGRCIRPDHLFLGSQTDNIHDMVKKRRQSCGRLNGSKHGMHKLTKADVRRIRALYEKGEETQREIAERFDVCFQMINHIVLGKNWTHV